MNTKTFAQFSRTILMQGVESKLRYWGFTEKGDANEMPVKIEGGYMFRGEVFDDENTSFLWQSLKKAVGRKGFDGVKEEAAYTWFNRMMAIHILSKNGYEQSQLDYAEGMQHTPLILQRARQGFYGFLSSDEQQRLKRILADYNQDKTAFAILLIGYCHSHVLLNKVFGSIDDYTELLLPDNMLSDNGFLHLLNTTDAISDEKYQEVELIGWLYQFYISEKKDEVFANFKKNQKAEAKDIPAATQIFTPNWIVKYMVQNTVGKLWLDLHPNSPVKQELKYLVESENSEYGNPIIHEVSGIKLLDPASGSGHILVEGFDLLFKIYKEEYYSDEEAVESILNNNLFGLDIDKRAAQLAQFAVLLKAAKMLPSIFKKGWIPHIYSMPEPYEFSRQERLDFLGSDGIIYESHLSQILTLMQQAQNLGSIMRFDVPFQARNFITNRLQHLLQKTSLSFVEQTVLSRIMPFIQVYAILSDKYEAVAANPPYMGQKNMNGDLKNYVNANYALSKSDLFAVFMEVCSNLLKKGGFYGMINQHSWMFLSSFEGLRNKIFNNQCIRSMVHLGPRTFGEVSGEVVQSTSFIIENIVVKDAEGIYYRLVDYSNSEEKHKNFLLRWNEYKNIPQTNFSKIPESPIAYWVSDNFFKIFNEKQMLDFGDSCIGMRTGDNSQFLRYWFEISPNKLGIGYKSSFEAQESKKKWFPYCKGGSFRRWFGNNDFVVNWENNGFAIKENTKLVYPQLGDNLGWKISNEHYYFKAGLTWSGVGANIFGVRMFPEGMLFDSGANSYFVFDEQNYFYFAGLLNTSLINNIIKILNPTINTGCGVIAVLPAIVRKESLESVNNLVECNFLISKNDWDSRETSWDFQQHPLITTYTSNLKICFRSWLHKVSSDFFLLHHNEEELNRIFIDIYGLQDELTPDVPLNEVTILQDEMDYYALEQMRPPYEGQIVPVKKGVIMQQLISYAIGCFMGRYRLDKPGLHIAHPNPAKEETASYVFNGYKVEIDTDAIIPLMGSNCEFPDDAVNRIKTFLDLVWGENTRIENLNFLQDCIDQDLEKFLVKDFWKFHCSMYKKKPIYWLFSSPKGAFQALVYMHRMNAFTVEKIRSKYLMDHLRSLRSRISLLEKSESSLSAQDFKKLDKLRKELQECEQYDIILKSIADKQIPLDLDDGVTENYKLYKGAVAEIK